MHEVSLNIPDKAYSAAKRRAKEEGFKSTEIFLASLIVNNVDIDNQDHLFTPQRLSELDQIVSGLDSGAKSFSKSEVEERFAQRREAWAKSQQS